MKKNISLLKTFFLIFFLFFFNCKNRDKRDISIAFHHWKSHLALSDFEKKYCTELNAKTLYLRFFDVDFNAKNKCAEPIAELSFNKNDLINFDKIIPTIFITNRTLVNTEMQQIDSLSTLIVKHLEQKIGTYTEGSSFQNKIEEILIDCDWTNTTKDKFFNLIKQLKTQLINKKITTTIRLHQIKFKEKTGVPPADKGLLMAYNTSDLNDPKTINSILDIDVLKSYISELNKYPLKLDIALPIFSWAIVYRDGQAVHLMPNFSTDFLVKNGLYTEGSSFEIIAENKIEILKNGYYKDIYLYADDVIKIEIVSMLDLKKAAEILSQNIDNQRFTISFFSLDPNNLQRFNVEDLKEIGDVFK
jgi:hypothetical protein